PVVWFVGILRGGETNPPGNAKLVPGFGLVLSIHQVSLFCFVFFSSKISNFSTFDLLLCSSQTLASPSANPTNSSSQHIWEFMGDEGIWTEFQKPGCSLDSVEIERLYQLNPQCQVSFTARRFSYSLYFSGMYQVNNKYGTKRAVRRIAITPFAFCVITMHFVSVQDIEAQYQQDSTGTMRFRAGRFSYELDFSDMTQTNLSTNTKRSVRRLQQ
uniref:Poly [ADP-ribose] polymerase 11-like n=1 Tax=Sinocyclocheilus grahami TaxID=75366 RepID=A0A672Q6G3_SINGR